MSESTTLSTVLAELTCRARAVGLTDSAWAARAGLPKETLSRLRRRSSCDLATLSVLAGALGARLGVFDRAAPRAGSACQFAAQVDREYEERLAALCASGNLDPERWLTYGSPFFMAGLAVMLAGMSEFDRPRLLAFAEDLHPGASEAAVFQRWLDASPVRPSRFIPLVRAAVSHAA